jgi:soluble lytic murein transglycosylase-like protein
MTRTDETNRRSRGWRRFILLSTTVAAMVLSLGIVFATIRSLERLPKRRRELESAESRVTAIGRRLARLKRREQLGDWIQQEIRRANPRLEDGEAREYGRLLLETTDKYNSVDPLFLLAIGIVESRFTTGATSHAHAKGLYQISPATGRWLAEDLGWELRDAQLYEPATNTELAACYLDKLFETYGDSRLVLAEYNGGPVNARRLRNGSDRLAAETRDYVVKVTAVRDDLDRRFDLASPSASAAGPLDPVRMAAVSTPRGASN